jgi:hypothetical protein
MVCFYFGSAYLGDGVAMAQCAKAQRSFATFDTYFSQLYLGA